jgi:hypothetical protein
VSVTRALADGEQVAAQLLRRIDLVRRRAQRIEDIHFGGRLRIETPQRRQLRRHVGRAALLRQVLHGRQLRPQRVEAREVGDFAIASGGEILPLQHLAEKIVRRQHLPLIVVVGVAEEIRVEQTDLRLREAEGPGGARLGELNVRCVLQGDRDRLHEVDPLRIEAHHRRLALTAGRRGRRRLARWSRSSPFAAAPVPRSARWRK